MSVSRKIRRNIGSKPLTKRKSLAELMRYRYDKDHSCRSFSQWLKEEYGFKTLTDFLNAKIPGNNIVAVVTK